MADPVSPRNAAEAIEQGFVEATAEEIAARKDKDIEGMRTILGTDASRKDPSAICRQPNSDGVTCWTTGCIDGYIFVYVCEGGVCMKRAFKKAC